jgi:hypothetical protein
MVMTGMYSRLGLPILLVCLVLVGAIVSAQSESTAEIGYDDGTAEAGRAVSDIGHGFAVRFTPAEPGDTLLRVSFYINGLRGDPAPIEVHVWDTEKNDLIVPVLATPTAEGWFDVDISSSGLIIADDVYAGYIQTSAENHPWLGVDLSTASDRSHCAPQWTPLAPAGACAMIRVLTQRLVAADGGLELAYDDGGAEAGRGYGIAGAGYAVRFTPPPGGATLQSVRLFISGIWGDPAPIEVHVWSIHGEDLTLPVDVMPTEPGWLAIDLSGAALRLSTDFCVGYLQTSAENYPWLGIDQGTPTGRSLSVPDWNELLPFGANAMIRVIFADEE